jgi:hypothetical protein
VVDYAAGALSPRACAAVVLSASAAACGARLEPPAATSELRSEEISYCTETTTRFGEDVCIQPIDPVTAAHRETSVRLHTAGGRVVRRELINGHGALRLDTCAIRELEWNGTLRRATCRDAGGVARTVDVFEGGPATVRHEDAHGRVINVEKRQLDARGFVISERYFDATGKPAASPDGPHEIRHERAPNGAESVCSWRNEKGEPAVSKWGEGRQVFSLDARSELLTSRLFDLEGRPTTVLRGFHECRRERDRWGNRIRVRFFGVDGAPAIEGDSAAAGFNIERDEHGDPVRTRYIGSKGEPIIGRKGFARVEMRYDSRGLVTDESYFGLDERPILIGTGYAGLRAEFDDGGRTTRMVLLGPTGQPTQLPNGTTEMRWTYDDRGNNVRSEFFDLHGNVAATLPRMATIVSTYDAFDHLSGQELVNAQGLRVDGNEGWARCTFVRDVNGEVQSRTCEDSRGAPVEIVEYDRIVIPFAGAFDAPSWLTATRDDARRAAEEARTKIANGAEFAEVARSYSLRKVARMPSTRYETAASRLPDDIAQIVKGLRPGELSPVFELRSGFNLIRRVR